MIVVLLNKFFQISVVSAPKELQCTILIPFSQVIVDWKSTLNQIMQVRWDQKTISDNHSSYVNNLVANMINVKKILERIGRNIKLSKELEEIIWVS